MKISYQWLQKYFDSKLPEPQKLADLFTNHVFEVESITKFAEDAVFEFKVLPDRAHYLLCHKGVARETSVITGLPLKPIQMPDVNVTGNSNVVINIADSKLCRRYMACEIENVLVGVSPAWLKNAIEAIGQRSINNLVDLGNFVMMDMGQPLHIFDADKVDGNIAVRLAKKGEKITILTGAEIILSDSDLVIADNSGPIAIAGVKGGKRAEVNITTKRIIIESANFDPTSVRKTATRLNLRNESSKRFENEITPAIAEEAMARIAALIVEACPKAVFKKAVDVYPIPAKEWVVEVATQYINSMIGAGIPNEFIVSTLSKMGCRVSEQNGLISVIPPFERLDLIIPEDISDEVARIWGYERLQGVLPPPLDKTLLPEKTFSYSEKIKNALVERQYSEVILYSLVPKGVYEITYPLAEDKAALRENLKYNLQKSLALNNWNADLLGLETVKIFEIGKIFTAKGEKTSLALGVSQVKKKKGLKSELILKEDIESLRKDFNIPADYKIEIVEHGAICEIDLDEVISQLPEQAELGLLKFATLPKDKKYKKFSSYPFAVRDIAFFVKENISEKEAQDIIEKNAGPVCIQVRLFDVFSKDNKKSFAFRLIFQSEERTLVDEEVNSAMMNVEKALKEKIGAEIR